MTPPPPPDTRDRILDAAEALFAERGLSGVTVRDISREVGLTPASLYNHFAGKQELYEAVLERGIRPLVELMQRLPSSGHSSEEREALIAAIMEHLGRRPHLPRLIQHEVIRGGDYLSLLGRSWIRPLLDQGIAELKSEPGGGWDEDEYALLITAWLNLVFGHFAMAPLLGVVFDDDPLSPESLERQTRFLQKLARLMMTAERDPRS